MDRHSRHLFSQRPTLLGKVAIALALFTLQLAFATHQFEHNASDIQNTCSVCLQLERLDDVDHAADEFVLPAASPDLRPQYSATGAATRFAVAHLARGPPVA